MWCDVVILWLRHDSIMHTFLSLIWHLKYVFTEYFFLMKKIVIRQSYNKDNLCIIPSNLNANPFINFLENNECNSTSTNGIKLFLFIDKT